jgi:hypothetical protein
MAKLTRIYTSGIGAKVARFSPLMVDFRNEDQQGDDSILWLRNGGGKTCWLALVYSVFRPRTTHFLLRKAKGKDSSIIDFIQANDLAYVITEWDDAGEQTKLFPDRKSLRVVGQVLAWKNGQKSDERSKLKQLFFSFRCNEKVNLDSLPVMGISTAPVKTYDDFADWLTDIQSRYPNLEITIPQNFDEWEEHLNRIGLDPALFHFQILMNQREGDIDQYFKDYCSTSQKFTNEFLKLAFEPSKADSVSENIVALRNKLQRRDPLLREEAFISSFLADLDPFLKEVDLYRGNQKTMDTARLQARGVQSALESSIAMLQKEREQEEGLARKAKEVAEAASVTAALLRQNINFIQVCYARLTFEAAKTSEGLAKTAVDEADTHHKTCKAAEKLAELNDLRNQERALQEALSKQLQKQQPILDELRRRGSIYRELLRIQLAQLDLELAKVAQSRTQLQNEARGLADQHLDVSQRIGSAESERTQYQSRVNQREAAHRVLLNNGILEEGEAATIARERLERALSRLKEEVDRLERTVVEKEIECQQIAEDITNQKLDQVGMLAKRKEHEAFVTETQKRRAHLENDKFILDLTGSRLPDLEFPLLKEGLKTRVTQLQQHVIQAEVDSAEDNRALKHLEQAGLLPPSLDVERALEQLKDAGITAFSAFDFLSQNIHDPEEALKLLLADPGKFAGIIVNRPEQLEEVRARLASRSTLKSPVQVSAPSVEPWPGEPARVVLPPSSSGTFNRPAAQDERSHIQSRLNKHKTNQEARALEIHEISTTIRDLTDYVDRFISKLGQVKRDLEGVINSEGILRIAIENNQEKLKLTRGVIESVKKEITVQKLKMDDHKDNVRSVTAFIRDHDTHYEANKQQVQELGERVAGLKSQSTQLGTDIERNRQAQEILAAQETQQRVDRRGFETEQSRVQNYEEHRPDIGTRDLSSAKADYDAQLDVYNRVSNSELQGRCNSLKTQITKKDLEYKTASKGLHAIKVEALARRSTLSNDIQAAESEYRIRNGEYAVAKAELGRLKSEHTRVAQECQDRMLKPEGIPEPVSPDQANILRAKIEEELKSKTDEERQAEIEASLHKRKHDEHVHSLDARQSIHEMLESLELGEGEASTTTLPVDNQLLRAHVKEVQRTLKEAERHLSQSLSRLDERFKKLQELLKQSDEPGCENAMKVKIGVLSREALIQGAAEIRESANARRTIIQKDLEAIEQDRQGILTELEIIYAQARHLLNSAERISRLPESMKAWANQPFLRIKLRELAPSDAKLRLQELLDAVLRENESPTGMELAYRSIVHVSGQDGIDVTILKPDVILRADRIPVESILHFSGGEGVTTAILLYCTLLQLRSQTYGRVTQSRDAGALILDNPIGKCSRPDLLKMHRDISKKMRVQLIYLTGVNDVSAIGTFDRIIRLKNQHKNIRNGDLHITVDADSKMEKAEIQMAKSNA